MIAQLYFTDGRQIQMSLNEVKTGNVTALTLPLSAFGGQKVEYADVCPDGFTAVVGDEGYAVCPVDNRGTVLTRFTERADDVLLSNGAVMPCFGFRKNGSAVLAIATGCANDLRVRLTVRENRYTLTARFLFDGTVPYEDVVLELHDLGDADYSAMAREYRKYMTERKGCVPIRERVKVQPELAYATEAIEIRIRLAWKPAPSPMADQTLETEPPMHKAMSFADVASLADKLKSAGVEKAELCLVGWNVKGHDGRWPQAFPVEEELGGEEGLRSLIRHVQSLGYTIVAHTNHRDMYKIADCWDDDKVSRDRKGELVAHPIFWSGGQPYVACPIHSYRSFAKECLPKVASLGFRGIHYVDVLTVLSLGRCHAPEHPASTKDTAYYYGKIQELSKELFGGYASEGPYDFAAKDLDFVLYTCFNLLENKPPLCDEIIPFWQLVYHGIILSNPGTETVNYGIKNSASRLKFLEYGGRPAAYIYSKFLSSHKYEVDWMGREDLTCESPEDTDRTVRTIKSMYDEYRKLSHLQYEFMEQHEKIADGVYRVTYSDGTVMRVDYNGETVTFE